MFISVLFRKEGVCVQDLVDQTDDSVVLTVKEQRRQHIVHVLLDIAIFVII